MYEACEVLCKRFKSPETLRLQKLISDLTNLEKNSNKYKEYIRVEDMQLKLLNSGSQKLKQFFVSILLKGFLVNFCTLVEHGRDKTLDEINPDSHEIIAIRLILKVRAEQKRKKSEYIFLTYNSNQKETLQKFCSSARPKSKHLNSFSKINVINATKVKHLQQMFYEQKI